MQERGPGPGATPSTRRWRYARWLTGVAIAWTVTTQLVELGVIRLPHDGLPRGVGEALGLGLVLLIWGLVFWALGRLLLRREDPGRGTGPDRLGLPHDVDLELHPGGERARVRLTLTADEITLEVRDLRRHLGDLHPPLPAAVGLADVDAVRTEAATVVLVTSQGHAPRELRLVPASYAARERLLWELAVRRPEAFRAVGAAPPSPASAAPRALPPTGPAAADAAPAGDARTHFAELDARAEPLGSGLVAADRTQRAPHRSKLGCGLFAVEPPDAADPTSPPASGR